MASDWISITIVNWTQFNGRRDVKHPSWFRVDYRMLEDPDFYDFTHEEFKAWLYLMAQACKKNSGSIRVSYAHAHATGRISRKGIDGSLKKLSDLNIANVNVTHTLRERHAHDTRQDRTGQTGQDKTNKQESFDFESVYKKYPRKVGKTEGIRKAKIQIRSQGDFDSWSQSVDRFVAHHRKVGTDPKFIPHFSTFMSSWRDWLDADAGTTRLAPAGASESTAEYLARKAREAAEAAKWTEPDAEEPLDASEPPESPEAIGSLIDSELAARRA